MAIETEDTTAASPTRAAESSESSAARGSEPCSCCEDLRRENDELIAFVRQVAKGVHPIKQMILAMRTLKRLGLWDRRRDNAETNQEEEMDVDRTPLQVVPDRVASAD